jgi:hypothetical protein
VRVGRHFQALHAPLTQNLRDAVHERGGDAASPPAWIDEQVFQLEGAAALAPGSEADKRTFGDRYIGASFGQGIKPKNQVLRCKPGKPSITLMAVLTSGKLFEQVDFVIAVRVTRRAAALLVAEPGIEPGRLERVRAQDDLVAATAPDLSLGCCEDLGSKS